MAYRIAGTYIGVCDCSLYCPCPTDGPPTGKDGQCHGTIVFQIREGTVADTDVSGVDFALFNHFPSNLTAGNWTVGVVVDDDASDEQVEAIERILSGQEGGVLGLFAALIGENKGTERAPIRVSNGSVSIGEMARFTFEPARGGDGSLTTVKNTMFGLAPEYQIGKGTGRSTAFGIGYEASYGQAAEFEFSSETSDVPVPR
jgi:hypothetical protein